MSESLEDIIELYVRGEASYSQQERLRNAIDNDNTLLDKLFNEALFENELNGYYSKNNTEDIMHRVVKACGAPPTRSHRRRRQQPHLRRQQVLQISSFALAASLLICLALIILTNNEPESQETILISDISGYGAVYQINDRSLQEISKHDRLPLGTRIWVGGGSEAHVQYADGTKLFIQPDTRLEFHEINNSKLVILDNGHVHAMVSKQPKGAPLLLRSQHAEVTVVGTRFDFRVDEKYSMIDVSEGVVRFGNKLGDSAMITAGEAAKVSAKGSLESIEKQPNVDAPHNWTFSVDERVTDDWFGVLSEGSSPGRYALLAAPRDAGEHHTIRSADYWHHPTFRIHEDSVIKMRVKIERKGFWHMFMLVQKTSGSLPNAMIELKPKMPKDYQVGEWVDLEFSLKDVDALFRAGDNDLERSVINDFFCFRFFLDSQKHDIGLALESFSISLPTKKKCQKH